MKVVLTGTSMQLNANTSINELNQKELNKMKIKLKDIRKLLPKKYREQVKFKIKQSEIGIVLFVVFKSKLHNKQTIKIENIFESDLLKPHWEMYKWRFNTLEIYFDKHIELVKD